LTNVTIINTYQIITFVQFRLFTKEKCFIFVKNMKYARKITTFDECRESDR
jgi:hypothetical protein